MQRRSQRPSPSQLLPSRSSREAWIADLNKQVALVEYDFTKDAGAVGTLSLGATLPAGAVVTAVFSDTLTGATSGGSATFKLQAGSTDLFSAIAFDDATNGIDAAGVQAISTVIPVKPSATVSSELKLAIAGAALTAGRVKFCVEFYISK